jgi:hypothetical protein
MMLKGIGVVLDRWTAGCKVGHAFRSRGAVLDAISGFLVVRKPEHANGMNFEPNLKIGDLLYRGIDRLSWEDLSLSYFRGDLPTSLATIWQELEQSGRKLWGLKVLKSYPDAVRVWEYWQNENEILAIRDSNSDISAGSRISLSYLGVDCVVLGEWSVLLNGPYARPEHFSEIVNRLNSNGLLDSENDSAALFKRYEELARSEVVEPIMSGARPTHIRVFSVASAG